MGATEQEHVHGSRSRSRRGRPDLGQDIGTAKARSSSGSASSSSTSQSEIVHFPWEEGMRLNSKYELLKLLGDGTFGRVVLARDLSNDRSVAIKIIRDEERYRQDAKFEAAVLEEIRKVDPQGSSGCVIMYETFLHAERYFCLVTEPLGTSLYDFLKSNEYRGFWMQDVQSIALQCMQALVFLHGQLRMTHTDLKVENILFVSADPPSASAFPRHAEWERIRQIESPNSDPPGPYLRPVNSQIKLIDFGNTTHEYEHHSSIINTRQYRSPEVLLELGWDETSDIWSIGAILMEIFSGDQLFTTHEELEHLALIERIVGKFPQSLMERAVKNGMSSFLMQDASTGHWRFPWPEKASSDSSVRFVNRQRPVREQVQPQHMLLADFVSDLLQLEAGKRLRAINSLAHPFFAAKYKD